MKPDLYSLIFDKIAFLAAYVISTLGLLSAWHDFNKRKIEEAREKSVGASAIILLKAEIEEMRERIRKGEFNDEEFKKLLTRMENDYDLLMNRFFEFFKPNTPR